MEEARPNTFKRVFCPGATLQAASKEDHRDMRWHHSVSSYYIKATTGFSSEVDRQLQQAAKLDEYKEMEKHVILLLDEMYIKKSLVDDKHLGELIGYTDLGDIHSHLTKLE